MIQEASTTHIKVVSYAGRKYVMEVIQSLTGEGVKSVCRISKAKPKLISNLDQTSQDMQNVKSYL